MSKLKAKLVNIYDSYNIIVFERDDPCVCRFLSSFNGDLCNPLYNLSMVGYISISIMEVIKRVYVDIYNFDLFISYNGHFVKRLQQHLSKNDTNKLSLHYDSVDLDHYFEKCIKMYDNHLKNNNKS